MSAVEEEQQSLREKYNLGYLSVATFSITLGNFLGGYQLGIFNTCQDNVARALAWREADRQFLIGLATALMPFGAMCGSMCAGIVANKFGRKLALIAACIIMILSSVLNAQLYETPVFMIGRFLGGVFAGISLSICPVFVKELAPGEVRGLLGSLVQLQITLGICAAYAMGIPLSSRGHTEQKEWLTPMFLMAGAISIVQIFLLQFVVKLDSPPWLKDRGRSVEAKRHLDKIYKEPPPQLEKDSAEGALSGLEPAENDTEGSNEEGYRKMFGPLYKKALFIACGLSLFQQLSGINAFIFYSTSMMSFLNIYSESGAMMTTIMGAINMLTTILVMPFVDKWGRRMCLVLGYLGMTFCLVTLLALVQLEVLWALQLVAILAFIAFFEISAGPVTWIYAPEILPEHGMSIVVFINWLFTGIVGFTFPLCVKFWSIQGTFLVYSILCFCGTLFVLKFVVETKGLSPEEIRKKLGTTSRTPAAFRKRGNFSALLPRP